MPGAQPLPPLPQTPLKGSPLHHIQEAKSRLRHVLDPSIRKKLSPKMKKMADEIYSPKKGKGASTSSVGGPKRSRELSNLLPYNGYKKWEEW